MLTNLLHCEQNRFPGLPRPPGLAEVRLVNPNCRSKATIAL